MKRITRDRLLTSEEATKYDAIREEIEQEKPEISERIRARIAEKKKAEADESCESLFAGQSSDDLVKVAGTLGVPVQDLTGVAVLVLPENVRTAASRDDLHDANESLFLVKSFKREGIPCKTAYDLGVRPKVMDRRGADIWLGVVWLFLENGWFPLAVSVMSEWLKSRYLTSKPGNEISTAEEPATIHVELRVQQKKRASTFKFDGPASHLITVLSALKELGNNEE